MHALDPGRGAEDEAARDQFIELRHQLDVLVELSETLRSHLEVQRDQASRRGDALAARALDQGVLQVTRVRNDVCCACRELDTAGFGTAESARRAA